MMAFVKKSPTSNKIVFVFFRFLTPTVRSVNIKRFVINCCHNVLTIQNVYVCVPFPLKLSSFMSIDAERAHHTSFELSIIRLLFVGN